MKLLVTRPQPGADATAQRILAAGHQPVLMPMFALHAVEWVAADATQYDALLLTSSNAVRLAGEGLAKFSQLPVYAVGTATANAAAKAGLSLAVTGDADAKVLLPKAMENGHRRLLWLAGMDRIELPEISGLTVDVRTVYASDALPAAADFLALLHDVDAILLHSPRAAAHFGWLCDTHGTPRSTVTLAAFSQAIANAAGDGWRDLLVSPAPNDSALLSLLASGPTV